MKSLQSFLGMLNYWTYCISHVSDVTKTLHELLKAGNDFVWLICHQSAFQRIKDTISKDAALLYHDAKQDLFLEVDNFKGETQCCNTLITD